MKLLLSVKFFKSLIVPAIILALVSMLLNVMEYRLMVIDHAVALYGGLVALIFTAGGIIVGRKISEKQNMPSIHEMIGNNPLEEPVPYEPANIRAISVPAGLSKREFEILELMAKGMSNKEISEKLFVSVHTVKSHASNLFSKLEVKSRTQAIVKAKSDRIIV